MELRFGGLTDSEIASKSREGAPNVPEGALNVSEGALNVPEVA